MTNEKKPLGILVAGICMAKNTYPGKDGKLDRFTLDIAVPGNREMLSISVPSALFNSVSEQTEFKSKVTFRTYKGNVYFEALG